MEEPLTPLDREVLNAVTAGGSLPVHPDTEESLARLERRGFIDLWPKPHPTGARPGRLEGTTY